MGNAKFWAVHLRWVICDDDAIALEVSRAPRCISARVRISVVRHYAVASPSRHRVLYRTGLKTSPWKHKHQDVSINFSADILITVTCNFGSYWICQLLVFTSACRLPKALCRCPANGFVVRNSQGDFHFHPSRCYVSEAGLLARLGLAPDVGSTVCHDAKSSKAGDTKTSRRTGLPFPSQGSYPTPSA